jgi:hypothetical protein
MNDPTTPSVDANGPVGFGEALARIGRVLISPRQAFAELRARPSYAVLLILLAALGSGMAMLVESRLDLSTFRELMERQNVPAAEIEQAMENKLHPGTGQRVISTITSLGQTVVLFVATAGLLFGLARAFGSELAYKQALSVTLHGLEPLYLVAALLSLPVLLSKESVGLMEPMVNGFLLSHLGALAPDATGPVAHAALASVDLFSIWSILLLVLGFRIVGGLSKGAATAIVMITWLIGVGIKLAMVSLLSGFMGAG